MKRIEIEEYHGGYMLRRFTDTCKNPECLEKHWVVEETKEIRYGDVNRSIRERALRTMGEWLP